MVKLSMAYRHHLNEILNPGLYLVVCILAFISSTSFMIYYQLIVTQLIHLSLTGRFFCVSSFVQTIMFDNLVTNC